MTKILITGGSGLVGHAISETLLQQGHEPRWLSREEGNSGRIKKYKWDLKKGFIDEAAFEGAEAIIHLAGAGIVDKRWTSAYKQEIVDSRVKSSELLFNYISKNNCPVKTLVGGSAIGYYGSEINEHVFVETDPAGKDFLAHTCVAWENSYLPFAAAGIRTAIIRTGIVLSNQGGAYVAMAAPFRLGLGAAIGNGEQYLSWIHISDLAGIFIHALLSKLEGTYNSAASEPVTNKVFSRLLAKSLHRPFFLPNVPEFALKLALGERAVTVTRGLKISNEKIKASGYTFQFDDLEKALDDFTLR